MNEIIENALLAMAGKAGSEQDDNKALKFSQAALNLAHAGSLLHGVGLQVELQKEKKRTGAS